MNLIQKIKENSNAARKRDWNRYAELLRADSPDPKAVAEIEAIIARLGRTLDQVQEDAGAVRSALHYVGVIERGQGIPAKAGEASQQLLKDSEEMQQVIAKLKEAHRIKAANVSELGSLMASSRETVGYLERLKELNPELLADVPLFDRDTFEPVPGAHAARRDG